jgi:TatD DNase family protein
MLPAAELPDVFSRARAAGVTRFLVPGTDLADSSDSVALAEAHPDVRAAVGVHPHEAKGFDWRRDGAKLEELARRSAVAAIGEIGLDFHYDLSPRDKQLEVLEWMLDLARRTDLPVVLHNRESGPELLALLERSGRRENAGVFHSFTENADYGRRVVDLGFAVSFSGMITFANAGKIRDAAAALPLDALLVETDTPYLAPVPHRGKRCEPAFVADTAKKLAEVRGDSFDRIAEATTSNYFRLFSPRHR